MVYKQYNIKKYWKDIAQDSDSWRDIVVAAKTIRVVSLKKEEETI